MGGIVSSDGLKCLSPETITTRTVASVPQHIVTANHPTVRMRRQSRRVMSTTVAAPTHPVPPGTPHRLNAGSMPGRAYLR